MSVETSNCCKQAEDCKSTMLKPIQLIEAPKGVAKVKSYLWDLLFLSVCCEQANSVTTSLKFTSSLESILGLSSATSNPNLYLLSCHVSTDGDLIGVKLKDSFTRNITIHFVANAIFKVTESCVFQFSLCCGVQH